MKQQLKVKKYDDNLYQKTHLIIINRFNYHVDQKEYSSNNFLLIYENEKAHVFCS